MDRYWLLTWTTYGTWLPGDKRGFVSPIRTGAGPERRHNQPGTPYDADMPGLQKAARRQLKCPPIYLSEFHAERLLAQFQETARYRKWLLVAVAIVRNHSHLVVGVNGDPDPDEVLGDFKSYGSRTLNRHWAKPASGTWWTQSGSTRKLPNEAAVRAAIEYVRNQPHALLIWIMDVENHRNTGERNTGERGPLGP
jgi:REP element-mobilizing transposase RayT